MSDALPHLMTVAAFLGWETPDGSDRWIDGMPEAMAPSTPATASFTPRLPVSQAITLLSNRIAVSLPGPACSRGQGATIITSASPIWRSPASRCRLRIGWCGRHC